MKDKSEKYSRFLVILSTVMYFIGYLCRNSYTVSKVAMEFDITETAKVVTGGFFAYAAGQLVSGFLGDRIKPERLILTGLLVTGMMNFLIPFCSDTNMMLGVWCVNGFAQSLLWPPLVKILSTYLNITDYSRATATVNIGGLTGTVVLYLLGTVFAGFWRALFYLTSGMAILFGVFWLFYFKKLKGNLIEQKTENIPQRVQKETVHMDKQGVLMLMGAVLCVMIIGFMRDGIGNNLSDLVKENFGVSNWIAIFSGVAVPVVSIVLVEVVSNLNQKKFRNEFKTGGVCFAVAFVCGISLVLLWTMLTAKNGIFNVLSTVMLCTLMSGFMMGAAIMIVCVVPGHFERYGKVSFVSGIINCGSYVGSSFSNLVVAYVSKNGWNSVAVMWSIIIVIGLFCCFVISRFWKKFRTIV